MGCPVTAWLTMSYFGEVKNRLHLTPGTVEPLDIVGYIMETLPIVKSCQLRLNREQPAPGWVLVNVATPTDSVRLAGPRIDPRDNGLGGPSGVDCSAPPRLP